MLARLLDEQTPNNEQMLQSQQYPSEYLIAAPLLSNARPHVGSSSEAAALHFNAPVVKESS